MSGESDKDSSDDEYAENFVLVRRFTIVILDCTLPMKEDLKPCLNDLYKVYKTLQTSAHIRNFTSGLITIGCKLLDYENENTVLIQPKTFDITKLQSIVDNFDPDQCVNKQLPFKEGIELATDLINNQCKAKNQDTKNIVFITNNPTPEVNEDDATTASSILSMNNINFTLLPSRFFTSSKFYNSFFKRLKDGYYEYVRPETSFLDTLAIHLRPPLNLQKTRFYFNENNYFEMKAMKMFQVKYRSLSKMMKTDDGKMLPAKLTQELSETGYTVTKLLILDDENNTTTPTPTTYRSDSTSFYSKPVFDKFCKIEGNKQEVVFTKEELTQIDQKCSEPKQRALYLMYLARPPNTHIADDVRSRLFISGHESRDQTMFYSYWLYCVQNDLVIYCIYLTKKRSYLILKPILFNEEPMFMQYCIGYANNYRYTKPLNNIDSENTIPNEKLTNVMGNILMELKSNDKGFLDLRDSKLLFEEALLKAKQTKTEFEFDDELTMENHYVDEKIAGLVKEFEFTLKSI